MFPRGQLCRHHLSHTKQRSALQNSGLKPSVLALVPDAKLHCCSLYKELRATRSRLETIQRFGKFQALCAMREARRSDVGYRSRYATAAKT